MNYKKHTITRTHKTTTTKRKVFGVMRTTVVFLYKVTCPDGDHFFTETIEEAKRTITERIAEDYKTHALSLLCLIVIVFTTACVNPHRTACINDATDAHRAVIAKLASVDAPGYAYNNETNAFAYTIRQCR